MHHFAILARELRKAARSRATYLLRACYLLLLVGAVFLVWWGEVGRRDLTNARALSSAGRQLYATFFLLEGILVALIVPILTCGAIADETEDRTLEVILTVPLRRIGLVTAKFASRLAYVFMLFLASLPVLIGCLLFGGVAPLELLTSAALLAAHAVWIGAITLLYSTLVRKGYAAALLTYVTVVAWSIGVPLMWAALTGFPTAPPIPMLVCTPPFYYLMHVLGELDRWLGRVNYAPEAIGVLLGTTALWLWLSSLLVGRRLQRVVPREAAAAAAPTRHTRILGALGWGGIMLIAAGLVLLFLTAVLPNRHWEGFAAVPARFALCLGTLAWSLCWGVREFFFRGRGYRPVWDQPFLWKEVALRGSLTARLASSGAAGAIALIAILCMEGSYNARDDDVSIAIGLTILITMVLLTAVVGGASITAEREQGLLDLLLVTPSPSARIFDGKVLGTLAHLAPLAAFGVAYAAVDLAAGILKNPGHVGLALALAAATLAAHAVLSCSASLRLRKSTIAILVSVALPLVLYGLWPLAYFLVWDILLPGEPRGAHFILMFQPSPFFFFIGLLLNHLENEWRSYSIGFYPGLVLNFALLVSVALAVRFRTVARLRSLARGR